MIDVDCLLGVAQAMSLADHTRRPDRHDAADEFGTAHVIMFGDYKQCLDREKFAKAADGQTPPPSS